ncbi:MAG: leucine-rich repeat domain-containing protein [Bacteroidales bacterium]|nr:leucine-rich repeat domain-containing protein [Bacteroidales bacterium]
MSKVINEKLTTIEEKLGDIEKAVLAGKRAISYALKSGGVSTTAPYTDSDQNFLTFKQYANLIKTLAHNPFMMEFNVADGTAYKRTVVLPINFASYTIKNSSGTTMTLNLIADEIVAANKDIDPTRLSKTNIGPASVEPNADFTEDHLVTDPFGNVCTDGDWIPTMEQIETYLDEDQQEEMKAAMAELGIDGTPKVLADDEEIYDYTVDWGDGSEECVFTPGATYEENKAAIWHTYEPGIYDVTITGDFRYVSSTRYYNGTNLPNERTSGGEYVTDNDGVNLRDGLNYGMTYSLTQVLAWGNTGFTNMGYSFCQCRVLTSIPMYDTTNSFAEVTDMSYGFTMCQKLTELPYNYNTDTGLFSNCDKITTFANTFARCTGITGSIPDKFMDGCSAVTTVAGMFGYAGLTGNLPTRLFDGMTSLTTASEVFASCSISGDISEELFAGCDNITTIYRLFYGCTGLTGRITRNVFGHLSKLTTMRQAFYNCSGITGIDPDAFHGLNYSSTGEGLNCRHAFYGCTKITEIPKGLFEGLSGDDLNYTDEEGNQKQWNNGEDFSALSGTGLLLENMFEACTGLKTISSTALTNLKVANARGIFGGCTALECALPDAPSCNDWDSLDTMEKWYGAFGNCTKMDGYSNSIPLELGGLANRKFGDGQVGKICVSNDGAYSLYEPTAYYNGSTSVAGTPVGIVYADTYLDKSRCIPTLSNGLSRAGTNTADSDTTDTDKVHKLLIGALNDTTKIWVDAQYDAEDLPNITNTSTYTVGYSYFYWSDSETQTKQYQRYNGEAYSRAINQFVVARGFSDIGDQTLPTGYTSYKVVVDTTITSSENFVITSLPDASSAEANTVYFSMDDGATSRYSAYVAESGAWVNQSDYDYIVNSSRYPAVSYANTYNTQVSAFASGDCFLPDACDLWDQFCMRDWLNDIITNRIVVHETGTTGTAGTIRTGTFYWASAESSSTGAWCCYTTSASLSNYSKWNSLYVRPSLALTLS